MQRLTPFGERSDVGFLGPARALGDLEDDGHRGLRRGDVEHGRTGDTALGPPGKAAVDTDDRLGCSIVVAVRVSLPEGLSCPRVPARRTALVMDEKGASVLAMEIHLPASGAALVAEADLALEPP